jgi:hypothetical protein
MKLIFPIIGIVIRLHRSWLGIWNLNQLVLISKKWINDPYFGCEAFATKSFDDFWNVKIDLLNEMEKEFENQLDLFVKHDDSTNIDFRYAFIL